MKRQGKPTSQTKRKRASTEVPSKPEVPQKRNKPDEESVRRSTRKRKPSALVKDQVAGKSEGMWTKKNKSKEAKKTPAKKAKKSKPSSEDEPGVALDKIGWKKGFVPPDEHEKLAAIVETKKKGKKSGSDEDALPPELDPCDDFLPLREPSHQDDWLHQYKEPKQTFSKWKDSKTRHRVKSGNKIYVVPLGVVEDKAPGLCEKLITFLKAYYFAMDVELMPQMVLSEDPKGEENSDAEEEEKGKEKKKKAASTPKTPKKKKKVEEEEDESKEEPSDEDEEGVKGEKDREKTQAPTAGPLYIHTVRKTRSREIPIVVPIPVRVSHPYDADKVHDGARQLCVTTLLSVFSRIVPSDAFCVIGVTMEDLYEDKKDSFVVGMAGLETRVGIFSFARYDPSFGEPPQSKPDDDEKPTTKKKKPTKKGKTPSKNKKKKDEGDNKKKKQTEEAASRDLLLLSRSCKVMAHEVAHMFGITHCVFYDCCLNGSGHLQEDFAQPLHLCPVDLHKLQHEIGFDIKERYAALLEFYQTHKMKEEGAWIERRLESIRRKEEEVSQATTPATPGDSGDEEHVVGENAKEVMAPKTNKKKEKKAKKEKKTKKTTTAHTPVQGTQKATEALLKIFKDTLKENPEKEGFSICTVDDNIYQWHVRLFGWDDGTQIKQDMFLYESVTGKDHVLLEVLFPPDFPDNPPFLRVVYPRFHQYTGHITAGGSICIKDLTRSGWDPKFILSSFFIMIRNLLLEGGALVDMDSAGTEYSEEEARAAFQRVAQAHGWKA